MEMVAPMKGFCSLCILWCEDRSCVDYFFLELYVSSITLVRRDCEPNQIYLSVSSVDCPAWGCLPFEMMTNL
jgi:hypothetical protein